MASTMTTVKRNESTDSEQQHHLLPPPPERCACSRRNGGHPVRVRHHTYLFLVKQIRYNKTISDVIEEMRELYEETTSVTLERATQEFGFIEREKENQRYSSL